MGTAQYQYNQTKKSNSVHFSAQRIPTTQTVQKENAGTFSSDFSSVDLVAQADFHWSSKNHVAVEIISD